MKKTIVAFGDSNTWGYVPGTGERHLHPWPTVLARALGEGYEVHAEGYNGRTIKRTVKGEERKSGIPALARILEEHTQIPLLMIMLGTNDAKEKYGHTEKTLRADVEELTQTIKRGKGSVEQVLLISPPAINETIEAAKESFSGGAEKILLLERLFQEYAEKEGYLFLKGADFLTPSTVDGYHLDQEMHTTFGHILAEYIKKNLP